VLHGSRAVFAGDDFIAEGPCGRHRILATDLDSEMLAKANRRLCGRRAEEYPGPEDGPLFVKSGDTYTVKDEVKGMVEFQRHNLLLDKFESGFDLILCRNVVFLLH
jgi:chemotaxis protein methyltransferase CheR